jgi:ABC-type transporter Mla maintaining outer membrane lipid asymmetry permease subunit MlaE
MYHRLPAVRVYGAKGAVFLSRQIDVLHVKPDNLPHTVRFEIIGLSLAFMGCFGGFRALFMPFGVGRKNRFSRALSLPRAATLGTDARSYRRMGRIFFAE